MRILIKNPKGGNGMENIFRWDSIDSVGVDVFDEQHKNLIIVINKLHQAIVKSEGDEILAEILQDMIHYTEVHFWSEEAAMERYDYPDFDEQKTEHKEFICKIKQFQEDYKHKKIKLEIDIIEYLIKWWRNHIRICDKKYEDFFKDKNITFHKDNL